MKYILMILSQKHLIIFYSSSIDLKLPYQRYL